MANVITKKIVNLNATIVRAPVPSQLQQSGAMVSIGGTTQTVGTYTFYGTEAALLAALSAAGNFAELTTMAADFFAQGNAVGVYVLELGVQTTEDAGIAALDTWIIDNPGVFYAYLVPEAWDYSKDEVGSVTVNTAGSGYTTAPAVTFSAPTTGTTATGAATIQNGQVVAITVTNPGNGYTAAPTVTIAAPTTGTTATATANLASALDIVASQYGSPTGKTYFFVTTTAANLANYSTQKAIFATVPSPTATSAEFQAAAMFYQWLVNNPGSSNRLAPMAFRYVYGVTPWADQGNQTAMTNILSAYGNFVGTGAEGGISNAIVFKGTTMDGEQAAWWYGIDWVQIQTKQALAAAVINGSNANPPLLYDQTGINSLQKVAQQICDNAVAFGCALSAVVNAVPFGTYTTQNPGDYNAGIYNGLSATVVGQNGFTSLTFNLAAVQL